MALRKRGLLYMQTTDAKTTATDEQMDAVSGMPQWFKVHNPAKQYWDPVSSVVIKDAGSPVTPVFIDYTGGYVLLGSPPSGAVTADFSYFATAKVGGVIGYDLQVSMTTDDTAHSDDIADRPEPQSLKWTLKADRHYWDDRASLTTSQTGANNDIVLTARDRGSIGNAISYEQVGGTSKSLGVTVTGKDIVVQLQTNGSGTVTCTTNEVRAAILANDAAMFLLVSCLNAPGDNGTGTPAVLAHTHLSGGVDSSWQGRMVAGTHLAVVTYDANDASKKFEGIGIITQVEENIAYQKVVKEPLTITGYDRIAWHSA